MSTSARVAAKHTRSLSRTLAPAPSSSRAFHSPFTVLAPSPLTTQPPSPAHITYEKQLEHTAAPTLSPSGTRTYVVSEPDPRATPYEVPYGAYPTSAPYQSFKPTSAPITTPRSSTSSSLAHPWTTRAASHNHTGANDAKGIQESASVRFAEAPGEMKAGSSGGLGLMDKATTKPGVGKLASRNPQPDDPAVAKKFSDMGNANAWKARS